MQFAHLASAGSCRALARYGWRLPECCPRPDRSVCARSGSPRAGTRLSGPERYALPAGLQPGTTDILRNRRHVTPHAMRKLYRTPNVRHGYGRYRHSARRAAPSFITCKARPTGRTGPLSSITGISSPPRFQRVFTISVRGPLCSQSHGCKALSRCRSGATARICNAADGALWAQLGLTQRS